MVINQFASKIAGAAANSFKGSGSGIGLTKAVQATHAAVSVMDVITKIYPIIDNIKNSPSWNKSQGAVKKQCCG